jgi:hypothetical protein
MRAIAGTARLAYATIALAALAWTLPTTVHATDPADPGFDCSKVAGLEFLLKERTVLLLGEIPGTVESPRFVADLLCNVLASGHTAAVALQLPETEGAVVARYLDSAGSLEDRRALLTESQELSLYLDGRFSESMVGLLESIRQLRVRGGVIDLHLFVPPDVDSLTRQNLSTVERPMAVAVWEAIEEVEVDLFIVLAGLTHTRVIPGSELDPDYKPMGYILAQWNPEWRLLSLALSHSGGTAWMCTTRNEIDCRAVPVTGGGWGEPNSIYIYGDLAETGYDGLYFVGDISHSPPARAEMAEPSFEEEPITELPFESSPDR